jgi:hypothetical protein
MASLLSCLLHMCHSTTKSTTTAVQPPTFKCFSASADLLLSPKERPAGNTSSCCSRGGSAVRPLPAAEVEAPLLLPVVGASADPELSNLQPAHATGSQTGRLHPAPRMYLVA